MDKYARVVRFVAEQPWAITPEKLAVILDLVRFRHAGGVLTDEEIRARVGQHEDRPALALYDPESEMLYAAGADQVYRAANGATMDAPRGVIAVLGVYGTITQRADMMTEMSGGTSVQGLTARFRAALADPAVKAIVFDVASPGGGVYGVQELAAEILAARDVKPTVAVANSQAASAAYWLASAAKEMVVTPSGEVGSIGVFAAHEDFSKQLEMLGVKVTLISAGQYKTEGNPFEPLTEEGRAAVQARVNDYYGAFVAAVAKGRGVSADTVRKGFGLGREVGAKQALAEGMVDRVATLDETIRRVAGKKGADVAQATVVEGAATIAAKAEMKGPTPAEQAEMEAAQARARVL